MKKRMLITTIVMMLVLAVALTTSSLAWFSASQATVTASGGSFTASTSNNVVALGISKTNGAFGDSISFTAKTEMKPLCMTSELKAKLDAYGSEPAVNVTDVENLNLNSVFVKTVNGVESFLTKNGEESSVSTVTLESVKLSSVYVTNLEQGAVVKDLKVNVNVTVPSESNRLVILGTYSDVPGSNDTGVIKGYFVLVVSSSTVQTYTVHTFGDSDHHQAITNSNSWQEDATKAITVSSAAGSYELVKTIAGVNLQPSSVTEENAIHTLRFDLYAWYDGVDLKSTTSGAVTLVNFQFEGVAA